MNIVKAVVFSSKHGADRIMLHTDLPSPFKYDSFLKPILQFEATKGAGSQYVRDNFGIEPETIEEVESRFIAGHGGPPPEGPPPKPPDPPPPPPLSTIEDHVWRERLRRLGHG